MLYEIKNRFTDAVIFSLECGSMKQCVEAAILAKADLRGSDMRGSDMRGSDMRGCDLRYSDMRGSDLRYSDLRYSNLRGSDLRGSDMRGSDMSGCDMSGCDLRGSDMSGCDMSGCDMSGSDLRGSDMSGSDMSGANFGGAIWIDGGSDRRRFAFSTLLTESVALEIRAGCRLWADFESALAHYGDSYTGNGDRAECIARLTLMRDELTRRTTN